MMNVSLTNEVCDNPTTIVYFWHSHSLAWDVLSNYCILQLQGPVTFTLDSRKFEYVDSGITTPKKIVEAAAAEVNAKKKQTRSDEPESTSQ